MTPLQNPVVGRKRLRIALRRAREASGRTQEQVAQAMDWSLSKVIRIETGTVGVSTNDMRALIQLYRISGVQADDLIDLARASRQRPWWMAQRQLLGDVFTHFIGLAAGASTVRMFQTAAIPGLFQTEAYSRACVEDFVTGLRRPAEQTHELIRVRMIRQREVLDGTGTPVAHAIIDEAVLRHVV